MRVRDLRAFHPASIILALVAAVAIVLVGQRRSFGIPAAQTMPDWATLAHELTSGSDAERRDAAMDILDATMRGHDPSGEPAVLAALDGALSDSVVDVRGAAARALAFGYPPDSQIEQALADRFALETVGDVRNAIIDALTIDAYAGAPTKALLADALAGTNGDDLRGKAAWLAATIGDPSSLPAVASAIDGVDLGLQLDMIAALGAYGSVAHDYVDELEYLATEGDDIDVRSAALYAIDQIQGP